MAVTKPSETTSTGGGTTDSGVGLTGFRTYNQDGTFTVNEFSGEAFGGMPNFSGNIFDSSTWVIPLYHEGDQNNPYDNPGQVEPLLLALYSAGYISESVASRGVWTTTAADALAKAMTDANKNGMSLQQLFGTISASGGSGNKSKGSGLGPAPLTDDDIKALGNKVAQGVLGRNLRDDEIANFIPAFRGTIGGGTSAATAGENVVRQVNPAEAYAHDVGNAMQMVSKMLGGMS